MVYSKDDIKKLLPKRPENSHKGTFGHVLNVAGSGFYSGAAYFSSIAPLKVGCGKVTLASEANTLQAVASLTPDVILLPLDKIKKDMINDFQAISIGCGLSREKKAINLFKKVLKLLEDSQTPVVIDADGLNILSLCHCETLSIGLNNKYPPKQSRSHLQLPVNTILTPHPRELSRLIGVKVEEILDNSQHWIKKCCEKYNCTTVLKLHKTLVADNNGNFYENTTGNSALAKGGSGDVLCGMISGFIAQGLRPFEASCLAVYLHGLAGELASKDLTEYCVLASDLINYIPNAIKKIN